VFSLISSQTKDHITIATELTIPTIYHDGDTNSNPEGIA
jgi:hypothetical protein